MIWKCPDLLGISVDDRRKFLRDLKICDVCMSHKNDVSCRSKYRCTECEGAHSLMICPKKRDAASAFLTRQTSVDCLYPTAMIRLKGLDGYVSALALLDQCANANFISKALVVKSRLNALPVSATFSGLNKNSSLIKEEVKLRISNKGGKSAIDIRAYVIDQVLKNDPDSPIQRIREFEGLDLANPDYDVPSEVSLLLGGGIFSKIIQNSLKKSSMSIAQLSKFGWLISGEVISDEPQDYHSVFMTNVQDDEDDNLQGLIKDAQRYLDYGSDSDPEGSDDPSINHFEEFTSKESDGRYVVRILLLINSFKN